MARRRKTEAEKADEARRYALARSATTDEKLLAFLTDPNQAIRNEAAANPRASAAVLARFADDPFWSTRIAVAQHPNADRATVMGLLEPRPRKRSVVHHAARERLEAEGVAFGEDGMPVS